MKATGTLGLTLSVAVQARLLWTYAESLNQSFDFPDSKHLYIVSFLALSQD